MNKEEINKEEINHTFKTFKSSHEKLIDDIKYILGIKEKNKKNKESKK